MSDYAPDDDDGFVDTGRDYRTPSAKKEATPLKTLRLRIELQKPEIGEFQSERDALRDAFLDYADAHPDEYVPPQLFNMVVTQYWDRQRPAQTLEFRCASEYIPLPKPVPKWLVKGWVPIGVVTLLYGDGGVGKTLLALQLSMAMTNETRWIGLDIEMPKDGEPSGVVYFGAEDGEDLFHMRLKDIAEADGMKLTDGLRIALLDQVSAYLVAEERTGEFRPTPLWGLLRDSLRASPPRLLVIDNIALTYGAKSENERRQATEFIRMFALLADELQMAVVVVGHPSLAGIATGRGTSGSTGFRNSSRAHLYLKYAKELNDKGEEVEGKPRSNLREFSVEKSNGGASGLTKMLEWRQGLLVPVDGTEEGAKSFGAVDREKAVEAMFMTLLDERTGSKEEVSMKSNSRSSAGKLFAATSEARKARFGERDFDEAKRRLLRLGTIAPKDNGKSGNSRMVTIVRGTGRPPIAAEEHWTD